MAEAKTISTEQLQQRLKQGNGVHLWNVLTDGYFKGEMGSGRSADRCLGASLSITVD